jgi:hypothetical protein
VGPESSYRGKALTKTELKFLAFFRRPTPGPIGDPLFSKKHASNGGFDDRVGQLVADFSAAKSNTRETPYLTHFIDHSGGDFLGQVDRDTLTSPHSKSYRAESENGLPNSGSND